MLFGGYIILSLSVINCYHSLSKYNQTRTSRNSHTVNTELPGMLKKVNKQFYHKYNYFLLVSTVTIVNILRFFLGIDVVSVRSPFR